MEIADEGGEEGDGIPITNTIDNEGSSNGIPMSENAVPREDSPMFWDQDELEAKECLSTTIDEIVSQLETSDRLTELDSQSPTEKLKNIEILCSKTITGEEFFSSSPCPSTDNNLRTSEIEGVQSQGDEEISDVGSQQEKASEGVSSESSPPTFKIQPAYDYTRVTSSPLDINIPDIDEEDLNHTSSENGSFLGFASVYEKKNDESYEKKFDSDDDMLLGTDIEDEPMESQHKNTDDQKYFKIAHEGQTFLVKVQRANLATGETETKSQSLNNSLVECLGCHFKMLNVKIIHECIPDFCVSCQVSTNGNSPLHILEQHMKDLKTCPFCNDDLSSLQQLEVHLSKHTALKIRPSICLGCKLKFQTTEGRVAHQCLNTQICKFCNIVFSAADKLSDHQEAQHKNELLQLQTCAEQETREEKVAKASEELEEGESNEGAHVCEFCDKKFMLLSQLDVHVSLHLTIPEDDEPADDLVVVADFTQEDKITGKENNACSPEKIRCPHCTLSASDKNKINDHLCSAKFCKHCLKQFGGLHEFEAHMVEYHCFAKTCQFCDAEFETSNLLIEHVKLHTRLEIRPFCCSLCNRSFNKEEVLLNHKCQGKGQTTKSSCKDCKIYFQSETAQVCHLLDHHSQDNFCPLCKAPFDSAQEILSHMEVHFSISSKVTTFCGKCTTNFELEDDFYAHRCIEEIKEEPMADEENVQTTDTEQILVCSICGKEFPTEDELEDHLQRMVEQATEIAKKKNCSFCEVIFATRSSFETHMIQHHLSALQCPFCLKFLSSRRLMEQHLLHHTNIHRLPKYCKICSKVFFSEGLFENHSCESESEEEVDRTSHRSDTKEAPNLDSTVEAEMNDEAPLDESIGGSRKVYYCPVCNKGFKGKKYLEEVHLATHYNEKSFVCNVCQRQLKSAETLKQHLLLHRELTMVKISPKKDQELLATLPVPHMMMPDDKNKCLPCRRVFANESELEKHNLVHSYSAKVMDQTDNKVCCKFCNFKMESDFWAAYHYTNNHNIISLLKFQCIICKVNFATAEGRKLHFCPKKEPEDENGHSVPIQANDIKTEPCEEKSDADYSKIFTSVKKGRPVKILQVDPMHLEHPCVHCFDVFVNAKSLAEHYIKVRYCLKCKRKFGDKDTFEQHIMYQHSCAKKCGFCNATISNPIGLEKHLKTHTRLRFREPESIKGNFLACRSCESTFKQRKLYEKHIIENHMFHKKLCPFCSVHCGSNDKMRLHANIHTSMNIESILKDIEEKETKKELPKPPPQIAAPANKVPPAPKPGKPVKASSTSESSKSSSQNRMLRSNEDSGDDVASKSTVKSSILVSGNLCLVCNKRFLQNKVLYYHVMDKHWRDSPQCPFCEKSWYTSRITKSHILKTHKVKMTGIGPDEDSDAVESTSQVSSFELPSRAKRGPAKRSMSPAKSTKSTDSKSISTDTPRAVKNSKRSQSPSMDSKSDTQRSNKNSKRSHSPPKSVDSKTTDTQRSVKNSKSRQSLSPAKSTDHENKSTVAEAISKCSLCSKVFYSQEVLDAHIRSSHHIEPAKAHLLEKTITPGISSSFNQKAPGENGPDKSTFCFHCHTSFNTSAELRAHGMKAGVFCEFCKKTLPDTNEYEMHMLEEHPMDDTCQFCGAYIPNKAGLEIHIRRHTNIGPIHYKCFGCNQMFRSSKDKDEHACIAFACPKCNQPQKGPDGLEEHMKSGHASPEPSAPMSTHVPRKRGRPPLKRKESTDGGSSMPSFDSEAFPKKQKSDEDNSSYSSTQKSEGKRLTSTWICCHCDRSFPDAKSLITHASSLKIYCKVCKTVMPSKEELIAHKSTHEKERNAALTPKEKVPSPEKVPQDLFVCRFCGEQFNTYAEYDEHSKSHVINQCKTCYKIFENEIQLLSHAKTHLKSSLIKMVKIESDSDSDEITVIEDKKPARSGQFVML